MATSGWVSLRLGAVCTKIGSGATPRGGSRVYEADGPVALIRSQNVHNEGFRSGGLAFIGDRHASELRNVEVLPGDVLLNITGDSVARACQVDPTILPARVNQHVAIVRPDPEVLHPGFLRYSLVSPELQSRLLSWAGSGGTRSALTKEMIGALEVVAPADAGEQRIIADILGRLDDKIALNRRMSETLETMTRALFKSWFVQFDPVRVNLHGLKTAGLRDVSNLFPNRYEETGLGEIPHGWRVGRLGDVVEQLRVVDDPRASPDSLFSHYSIPAFDNGHEPKPEFGNAIKSHKWRVPDGTILLSKLNPEIERVWLVDVQPGERAVCSTEFIVLRPREPFTRTYAYCLARSPFLRQRIEGLVTGTSKSHQRAAVGAILDLEVIVPPPRVIDAFEDGCHDLIERLEVARREIRALAELRDRLLPKLITGQLRVPQTDRILQAVSG